MLTLTENATSVVRSLTERPNTTGLRIAERTGADSQGSGFAVTAVKAPQAADEVVEQDGATIYLDQTAAAQLANQVLDADMDHEGRVQFALAVQEG